MKLIVAQGNPGKKYERTRHNVGFVSLESYAHHHSAEWRVLDKFNARIAEVTLNGERALLIEPQLFYNETGPVIRKLVDFYKLTVSEDVIVIHDDLALPLGTLRIREKGSDAGNNGIKSLNSHLGDQYWRIRVGVWSEERNRLNDIDFVLGAFSRDEETTLQTHVVPKVHSLIDAFINGTLEATSHRLAIDSEQSQPS